MSLSVPTQSFTTSLSLVDQAVEADQVFLGSEKWKDFFTDGDYLVIDCCDKLLLHRIKR